MSQSYPDLIALQQKSLNNVAFGNISVAPLLPSGYSNEVVAGANNSGKSAVARLLRRLMEEKGLGVKELNHHTEIAKATIHRHLAAQTMPRLAQRKAYSAALNTPIEAFEREWQESTTRPTHAEIRRAAEALVTMSDADRSSALIGMTSKSLLALRGAFEVAHAQALSLERAAKSDRQEKPNEGKEGKKAG